MTHTYIVYIIYRPKREKDDEREIKKETEKDVADRGRNTDRHTDSYFETKSRG